MEQVSGVIEVARGISDFGMLEMAAAAFIVMSLVLLFFVIRWFMRMVNQVFGALQKTLDTIAQGQINQEGKLDQLKEALTGEMLNQVRVFTNYAFDYNMHQVCVAIGQIKEENNLENREAVEKKLRAILGNLYNRRNSDFDAFAYNGKKLSFFTDHKWADRIYEYCMASIYDGLAYHRRKYLLELGIFYEEIKVEFMENLRKTS